MCKDKQNNMIVEKTIFKNKTECPINKMITFAFSTKKQSKE